MTTPEPWLRGPIAGIPAMLQPAAHALVMAQEEVERALVALSEEDCWAKPGGIASVGFHVVHLSGSTDRLLTYARGEQLSDAQLAELAHERAVDTTRPPMGEITGRLASVLKAAMAQFAETSEETLFDHRAVGRAQLPSNVLGLLMHAAEHASRHAGQIASTVKLIKASREREHR